MLRNLASNGLYGSLALLTYIPNAYALLPCKDKWTGPSIDNRFDDCDLGPWVVQKCGLLFLPFILFLIVLVCLLFAVFGRYVLGCCGSYRRRPGHICCGGNEWDDRGEEEKDAKYSKTEVLVVKFSVVGVLIVAVISMILMMVGIHRVNVAYTNVWTDVTDLVDWGFGRVKMFRGAMDFRGSVLETVVDQTSIDQTMDAINQEVETFKENVHTFRETKVDKFWKPIRAIGCILAFIPLLLFGIAVVLAFFNVRRGGPIALIICAWLVGILLCLLALLLSAVNWLASEMHDELNAHAGREPGLLQWYVLPNCLALGVLEQARQLFQQTEQLGIQFACKTVQAICAGNGMNGDASGDSKPFSCPFQPDDCTSLSIAHDQLTNKVVVKHGLATNVCKTVGNKDCNLRKCATDCVNQQVAQVAAQTVSGLDAIEKMMSIINEEIVPYLDCNALMDQVLLLLSQVPVLKQGAGLLAAGAYLYCVSAIALIILMFLGQKRFIKLRKFRGLEEPDIPLDMIFDMLS